MKFLKRLYRLRSQRAVRAYLNRPATATYTRGDEQVHFALTPGVAREVHDRAMRAQNTALAALVEPCIPQGGKVTATVADRAMIRRLMKDAAVV